MELEGIISIFSALRYSLFWYFSATVYKKYANSMSAHGPLGMQLPHTPRLRLCCTIRDLELFIPLKMADGQNPALSKVHHNLPYKFCEVFDAFLSMGTAGLCPSALQQCEKLGKSQAPLPLTPSFRTWSPQDPCIHSIT